MQNKSVQIFDLRDFEPAGQSEYCIGFLAIRHCAK